MTMCCPTCGATNPDLCGLGEIDAGCDHQSVAEEFDALLRSMIDGSTLAQHRRNYDRWRQAWFASAPPAEAGE